jgi:hypothetical protein
MQRFRSVAILVLLNPGLRASVPAGPLVNRAEEALTLLTVFAN